MVNGNRYETNQYPQIMQSLKRGKDVSVVQVKLQVSNLKNMEKKIEIMNLLIEVDDELANKFLDVDSDKLLDEKIEVLKALKDGKKPDEIEKYYKVLELYPEGEMWD